MSRNYNMILLAMVFFVIGCGSSQKTADTVTGATTAMTSPREGTYNINSKKLIILYSTGNNNTAKIANAMAKVLDADVKSPQQVNPDDIEKYDLIGFGSGIFDQRHHIDLLEFVDLLPFISDKNTFIFSTSGISRNSLLGSDGEPKNKNSPDPHTELRTRLLSKGFIISGEFNCAGFNDNSFLKLFGGMNKGRPNEDDLKQAEEFARNLIN
jgi:flavodoxin